MIIAIDGPAASGKGTIAKGLAKYYGLPHLRYWPIISSDWAGNAKSARR